MVAVMEAHDALRRSSRRFTTLLRSDLDGRATLPGSVWTVRDVAAHLVTGALAYRDIGEGGPSPYTDLDRRAATNQSRLEAEHEQDLGVLADRIDTAVEAVLASPRAAPEGGPVPWHGGLELPVTGFLGAAVGEFEVHGRDVARATGRRWRIGRADALVVVDFFTAAAPRVVDADAARGFSAVFDVRFRGGEASTFAFDEGVLTVGANRPGRADVHLLLDPAAFVLLGYKRVRLAGPVLTGGALAWGRRPWLALRFAGLFQAP